MSPADSAVSPPSVSAPGQPHPRPRRVEIVFILGALIAFGPLSVDMYLPAFPVLSEALDADRGQVQLTLAVLVIAIAIGQLVYGPLTDRFGRKPPLYFGMTVYIVASAGCAMATSLESMVALRFLQGLGACAGGVVARAVVADLYEGPEAARTFSFLMLVMGVAPILAPLIGGFIVVAAGWRPIFWLLTGLGVLGLAASLWRLPETHPPVPGRTISIGGVARDYGILLADRRFMGIVVSGSLSLAGMFAYIATAPFVFIEHFGISPDAFGYLFGANAAGFVTAGQVNARLVARVGSERLMVAAGIVQLAAGLVLAALAALGIGGMFGVIVPLWVYVACLGFIMPNNMALALGPHRDRAGSASAVLGTLNFGIGGIAAILIGLIGLPPALSLALPIAAAGVLAVTVRRWVAAIRWS